MIAYSKYLKYIDILCVFNLQYVLLKLPLEGYIFLPKIKLIKF